MFLEDQLRLLAATYLIRVCASERAIAHPMKDAQKRVDKLADKPTKAVPIPTNTCALMMIPFRKTIYIFCKCPNTATDWQFHIISKSSS